MRDADSSSVSAEERAAQSVSARFTRIMNATTSPWGMLTDPPLVALASGALLLAFLGALGSGVGDLAARALGAVAVLPLAIALALSLALRGARRKVVAWLARQPFPVDNMNAVLNGLGEELEVSFTGAVPDTAAINALLDRVHPDAFVTRGVEDARAAAADEPATDERAAGYRAQPAAGPRTVDIRIGVVDSKRNPAASNHARYVRVRELVERALVPLAKRYPIDGVRVK